MSPSWRTGWGALAGGAPFPGVVEGAAGGLVGGRVALVFPGQGSQWVGMGAELVAASAVFGEWIDGCEAALAPFVDWSLREVLAARRVTGRRGRVLRVWSGWRWCSRCCGR